MLKTNNIDKQWLETKYIVEKLSPKQIGKIINVSNVTILNYLKKYNIPTRTISQSLTGRILSEELKNKVVQNLFKANELKKINGVGEEEKERLRAIRPDRTGLKHSYKTIEKMRKSALGRKNSLETKMKMSETRLNNIEKYSGKNHPQYGKKRDDIRGEKHFNWNGNITPFYKTIRSNASYKNWRSDCFERDDYTCKICDLRGVELHVDHIKPFAVILKENKIKTIEQAEACLALWDISNGRTLCAKCHRKTDTYGRPKKHQLPK